MTQALAAMVVAGIALPHVLHLQRVAPSTAIVLWLNGLALRALAAVLAVIYVLYFLPRTGLFVDFSHWCAHAQMPFMEHALNAEGHALVAVALYLPAIALLASLAHDSILTVRQSARRTGSSARPSGAGRGAASSSRDPMWCSPSRGWPIRGCWSLPARSPRSTTASSPRVWTTSRRTSRAAIAS
jgi:hypothetical protein